MKIVMVSNHMIHHQLDMCNRLYELCPDFHFICAGRVTKTRKAVGYSDLADLPYVHIYPKDKEQRKEFARMIMDADIAIFGSCPNSFIRMRLSKNKISFLFSERVWKKGTYRRFIPFVRKKVTDRFPNDPNLYVLCASSYLASDLKSVGFSTDRCFTWGYFPPFEKLDIEKVFESKPQKIHILWLGRFISWKHCDDVIRALSKVKRDGYDFVLDIVGDGDNRPKYEKIVVDNGMEKYVNFFGFLPQQQAREIMKKSHIFIATSDFQEGWGAVVNEAMSSLCAPIVSHAMGSCAFLIENGYNGLVYKSGNIKNLVSKVEQLLSSPEKIDELAINAYNTIQDEFNGTEAANRLMNFIECLLEERALPEYKTGPFSKSPIIKNNWFKR